MALLSSIFPNSKNNLKNQIENVLSLKVGNIKLYEMALCHRSVKDDIIDNNERLEYLGDAVLSSIVADYLFKRYATKGEGFLTEMRSKMVNRQRLNDIAIKMGFKQLMIYNKADAVLRNSQIFGNTLEAVIGAVYLDKGYLRTQKWVLKQIVLPHMFVESLEGIDINLKNKLIGWATKNGKNLIYNLVSDTRHGTRRVFTINVEVDGEIISEAKGLTKKEASMLATQHAIDKLGL